MQAGTRMEAGWAVSPFCREHKGVNKEGWSTREGGQQGHPRSAKVNLFVLNKQVDVGTCLFRGVTGHGKLVTP
jgi:hypothetical protein